MIKRSLAGSPHPDFAPELPLTPLLPWQRGLLVTSKWCRCQETRGKAELRFPGLSLSLWGRNTAPQRPPNTPTHTACTPTPLYTHAPPQRLYIFHFQNPHGLSSTCSQPYPTLTQSIPYTLSPLHTHQNTLRYNHDITTAHTQSRFLSPDARTALSAHTHTRGTLLHCLVKCTTSAPTGTDAQPMIHLALKHPKFTGTQ